MRGARLVIKPCHSPVSTLTHPPSCPPSLSSIPLISLGVSCVAVRSTSQMWCMCMCVRLCVWLSAPCTDCVWWMWMCKCVHICMCVNVCIADVVQSGSVRQATSSFLMLLSPPVNPSFPRPLQCGDQGEGLSFSSNKSEATPVNWAVQIGPYGALFSMQRDAVWLGKREERRGKKRKGEEMRRERRG